MKLRDGPNKWKNKRRAEEAERESWVKETERQDEMDRAKAEIVKKQPKYKPESSYEQ